MKQLAILILVFFGIILSVQQVQANALMKWEDVASMQIYRTSGGTRTFNENDGIEAFVIQKVIEWINTSSPVKETTELADKKTPIAVIKIKMKNGDVAIVEPAYDCHVQNKTKFCTLADGDVILTRNNQKIRLKSVQLFDWLLVKWKHERTTPPQDTKEMMINDILMLLLSPEIDEAVSNYYSKYYNETPMVYPYQIDIEKVERIGGFRTFHFLITLEITPVFGAHNPVGKDRLTFEIAPTIPGQVKLKKFEHLESYDLPPHLQDLIKQKMTNSQTTATSQEVVPFLRPLINKLSENTNVPVLLPSYWNVQNSKSKKTFVKVKAYENYYKIYFLITPYRNDPEVFPPPEPSRIGELYGFVGSLTTSERPSDFVFYKKKDGIKLWIQPWIRSVIYAKRGSWSMLFDGDNGDEPYQQADNLFEAMKKTNWLKNKNIHEGTIAIHGTRRNADSEFVWQTDDGFVYHFHYKGPIKESVKIVDSLQIIH